MRLWLGLSVLASARASLLADLEDVGDAPAASLNFALWRPTTYNATHGAFFVDKANDGNADPDYYAGSCFHTKGDGSESPFWQVMALSTRHKASDAFDDD